MLAIELTTEGGRKGIQKLLGLAGGPGQRGMEVRPGVYAEGPRGLHTVVQTIQ